MVEDIRKMISNEEDHPRNTLLDQINTNASALISELSRFRNIIGERRIISFFEQRQTRGLARVSIIDSAVNWRSIPENVHLADLMQPFKEHEDQSWTRSGGFLTAVEVDSAVLQLPDSMEIKIPLNSDHSNMVKFDSRQDLGYTSALQYLKDFERDAPTVIADRFGT